MKETWDPSATLREIQPDWFVTRFHLTATQEQYTPDHASYMDQVHFLEEVTAQLAWSLSTEAFSDETAEQIRKNFDVYNVGQIISDIINIPKQASTNDFKTSGSKDLAFVDPKAKVETAKYRIKTATFSPFALDILPIESQKDVRRMFPNFHTNKSALFLTPVVMRTYPITIHVKGDLPATIVTASVRYIKTWREQLQQGVHTRTVRTWDYQHTQRDLNYLLELSMLAAQDREHRNMTDLVIDAGKMDGNK